MGGSEEREEDVVVKEGEEVNQVEDPYQVPTIALSALVPTVEPILVPISDSNNANDLYFPKV